MTKIETLVHRLSQLQIEYGLYHFQQALREIKRRRLEVSSREKRKRFPWSKYQTLYHRQHGVCPLCKELMPLVSGEIEIDHRDPNKVDGFNDDGNLQLTHKRCNRSKSSKTIYDLAKAKHKTVIECL